MAKDPYIGKIVSCGQYLWRVIRKKPLRGAGPQSWEHTRVKYYLKRLSKEGLEVTGSFSPEQFEVLEGDEETLEILYAEKANNKKL